MRIIGGCVARRIAVDPDAQPVIARARDGLWIAAGNDVRGGNRVDRIDPKPDGSPPPSISAHTAQPR